MTNSHCTTKEFSTDGTIHYQPLPSETAGKDVYDPSAFRCGSLKCKCSDAAFSERVNERSATLGAIAMVEGLNINGTFKITGKHEGNSELNVTLAKVGRTTGKTEGKVTKTCVDVKPIGSNIIRLCQDIVEAMSDSQIVAPGDSGSPVFSIKDDPETSETEVVLYGILWGGSSDGKTFVFSPISNVEKDLGELKVVG